MTWRILRPVDRALRGLGGHPYWSVGIGILTIVGVVIAIWQAGVLEGSARHYYRLGEATTSGPAVVTPLHVQCGKTIRDVPSSGVRGLIRYLGANADQICFLSLRIYNSSHNEMEANGSGYLFVGSKSFRALSSEPQNLPLLFPNTEAMIRVVFALPPEVLPTSLAVGGAEEFASPPHNAPVVYYTLAGAL